MTSALLDHEVVLLVYFVLLGKGKRLFAKETPPHAFALESTQALPSGIVINALGPLDLCRT